MCWVLLVSKCVHVMNEALLGRLRTAWYIQNAGEKRITGMLDGYQLLWPVLFSSRCLD